MIAADVTMPRFLVATDARRQEVYWARYDQTGRYSGPHVNRPGDIDHPGSLPAVGEGARRYEGLFPQGDGPMYPAAATLCRLAAAELAQARPPGVARRDVLLPRRPAVPAPARRP